jgi:hypothetical protein
MITILNSWSFESNSNKSVEKARLVFDSSIQRRSSDHFATANRRQEIPAVVLIGASGDSTPPFSRLELTNFRLCKWLIARVCTVLHANKYFFFIT